MTTQRELLGAHAKELDDAFVAKYPNGRYCVQYRGNENKGSGPYDLNYHEWSMHYVTKRPTSHVSPRGVSITFKGRMADMEHYYERNTRIEFGLKIDHYQNNSWGKVSYFDTLDKAVANARRREFPEELIEAFITGLAL